MITINFVVWILLGSNDFVTSSKDHCYGLTLPKHSIKDWGTAPSKDGFLAILDMQYTFSEQFP